MTIEMIITKTLKERLWSIHYDRAMARIRKLLLHLFLILLQKIFGKEVKDTALLLKLIEIFDGYPGSIVRGALLLKENNYLSLDEYKSILSKSTNPTQLPSTFDTTSPSLSGFSGSYFSITPSKKSEGSP